MQQDPDQWMNGDMQASQWMPPAPMYQNEYPAAGNDGVFFPDVPPQGVQPPPIQQPPYYVDPNMPINPGYDTAPFYAIPPQPEPVEQEPVPGKQRIKKIRPPREKKVRGRATPTAGKLILRTLAVIVALALIVFLILRFVFGVGKVTTAVVEAGVFDRTHSGDALIIRNETVYDDESVQDIDYVAGEATHVSRGEVVCYVYSTNYTTKEAATLQNDRDAIRDYENTLLSKEASYDSKMTRLEDHLLECALQIRQMVHGSHGNMANQETTLANAISERQDYFKTKYPNDTTLSRNFDNETTQQQKIDSWIQSKTAMQDGIVSFYTDGFENDLSPAKYMDYTPEQVRSMLAGNHLNTTAASRGRVNLYRIVQQGNYAVLLLMHDTKFEPQEGGSYKLVLEQFTDRQVDAQVLSYTRSGGDLLLRLAVMGDADDVLYMRSCSAYLGEYTDCLIVPQRSLYTKEDTVGLVMLMNGQQWFVPVQVLQKTNGKAYVVPVQSGTIQQGATVRVF